MTKKDCRIGKDYI